MGDLVAQLDIDPARKANAELWLSELSELSSSDKCGREKIDSQINGIYFEDTGDLISKTSSDSFITNSPLTSPDEFMILPLQNNNSPQKTSHANNSPSTMNNKSEIFRVSISSSAPSTSSQDEFDTFNEIFIWGENNINNNKGQSEILTPTVLQTDLSFLDAQAISCGARHLAVLSKNSEIFTWGEKFIGSLTESNRPHVVESVTGHYDPFEKISCGEFHTCVVTNSGELYTWGTETGHWMPKRVTGTMDLTIRTVSCGTWHTAFITANGQLYTFGDGTFGALGHGNRCNIKCPKLVESLNGLRVIDVSCGAWHTAGIVQVNSSQTGQTGQMGQTGGKLFTWGDGDKNRLGQGDKEARLKPTCVNSLIDHNFIQVSCGQSLTVCLTSQGEVFTFGSSVYGQLGNPNSDGRTPVSVRNPNFDGSVREISCGFYHVAVLTSKNEVFTWGKGQKGQLGHGDSEDRKVPTIVESLRDKSVKSVSCGASFTVAVILSKNGKKVVGGNSEQIHCSNCRQNFGFTRKKHVCYNCGLVLCNNCTSKKSFRANLAPNPNKPYRVCDSCYIQLNNNNTNNSNISNYSNNNGCNNEKKRNVNFPLVQIKDVALNNGNLKKVSSNNKKGGNGSFGFRTRPVSPFSRRPSPPRSATPGGPTTRGLSLSRIPLQPDGFSLSKIPLQPDGLSLSKANEVLNEEVKKLRSQVGGLKQKCESQEIDLKKLAKEAQDATQLASEESSKSKAAKEVIKTLTSQLKEMADKMPQDRTPLLVPNNTNGITLNKEGENTQNNNENNNKKVQSLINSNDLVDKEWIEQYEPGVYITLMTFHDGTRDLKRVRFSRRRFGENQAELWWNENREKVYEKYNVRGGSDRISSASSVRSSRV
ncbi:hypothetical protein LUZ60_007475 [Juncus effusus]|nr:hypothetical protein LUZ60_007475 [Juncus effusus]